jgi:hypothetical protein
MSKIEDSEVKLNTIGGLSIYDNALESKLLAIYPKVVSAPPDNAFERSNENGKIKLPFISFYRMSNPVNFEEFNHYESFRGRKVGYRTDGNDSYTSQLLMEGLPVTITYQIDIWAQSREYADGIYRELVFYLTTHPNLTIKVPNIDSDLDFALKLTDCDTSTDYDSFTDKNIIHRYTLTYELDNARMFFDNESANLIKEIPVKLVNLNDNKEDDDSKVVIEDKE